MKLFIVALNLLVLVGCGDSSDTDPGVVGDYGGLSRFEVFNNSNYTILIHCETNGYIGCNKNSIEAGDSQVIGEYGEIGGSPSPESVFISTTVSYDPGDGFFLVSHELNAENWEIVGGELGVVMYSYSIFDRDLLD